MSLPEHHWLILVTAIPALLIGVWIVGLAVLHMVVTMRRVLGYDTPFGNLHPRIAGLLVAFLGYQAYQAYHWEFIGSENDANPGGEGGNGGFSPGEGGAWGSGGFDDGGFDGDGGDF